MLVSMSMSVQIQWLPQFENNKAEIDKISLPIASTVLEIAVQGDVILGCRWQVKNGDLLIENVVAEWQALLDYLKYPNQALQVKLLQQGTQFRHLVWQQLINIPFAQTVSYGQLAREIHSSPRAVAAACRANPYPGIIPCHRVVSSSGTGGFMGQSHGEFVELKRQLLLFEHQQVNK